MNILFVSGLLRKPDSFPLDAARIHSPVVFAKSLHVAIIIKTIHTPSIFYVLKSYFQLMNTSAGHFLREKNLLFFFCLFFFLQ